MNNLTKRTLAGIAYIAIMLGGILLHPLAFAGVFATLLFLTQYEFYSLIEKKNYNPLKITSCVLGVLFFLMCFAISSNILRGRLALGISIIFLLIMIIGIFRKGENTFENTALSILGLVYIAIPFSLMNFVVHPAVHTQTNVYYPWILAGIFFIIWVNDTGAYLVGTALGKHKMCPSISPAKSWEGFIGGAMFAVIMGILNAVILKQENILNWIVIALITVTFGTLGDLFESKLKREIGIKDSGTIMPGHGGFLDRLDSLLFVVPAVFLWLMFSVSFQ